MKTLPERLRYLREKAGFEKASEFARAHNINEVTYRAHESGGRAVRLDAAQRYAKIFRVPASWVLTGEGPVPEEVHPLPAVQQFPSKGQREGLAVEGAFSPEVVEIPATASLPLDIPVYGTAMGGEGAEFDFNAGEVVDRVRRPPGLLNAPKAFALYVVGDSMSPRYDAGDLIFVHPGKPAVPGCDVVVELHQTDAWGGHKAMLKTYRGKTATKLLLSQINPEGPVEIELDQVKQILRVLRTHELMGI